LAVQRLALIRGSISHTGNWIQIINHIQPMFKFKEK
jgi:hypothetical protein